MRLEKLANYFREGFREKRMIAFAAESEGGPPTDLSVVGINLSDVVSWQVLGVSNLEQEAALWADLQASWEDDQDDGA